MYTGPNTVNDGLVFGYDTGYGVADYRTTTRFFKGAPTINYIHFQNAVAQSSYTAYSATSSGNWNVNHPNAIQAYNAQGGDITSYINQGVGSWQNTHHAHWQYDPILKKPVVVMNDVDGQWKAKSFGTGLGSWTSQGKTHGSTYTISWLQWVDHLSKNAKAGLYTKNSSGGNGFHDGQANSASAYNTKLNTWQRVYQTYTTNSNRDLSETLASIYMYGHYNVRATVKIADVQFTWGSTPFPFSAEYERSSTQSLIDLKRTNNINISNISFDSTGQPTFDGTDDYIDVTTNFGTLTQYSFEWVENPNATHKMPISTRQNNAFYKYGAYSWRYTHGGTAGELYHTTGATSGWHHWAVTYDGSTLKIFQDNIILGTRSVTGTADFSQGLKIGWWSSGGAYAFDGDIPVMKFYNKALTADEVARNFNAYKNRFNI
jgi:hypothetical protein